MALYTNIKGPINYTTVGSPTIVDGIASGFSCYPNTSSYIRIGTFTEILKSLKIQVKFKTGSTLGAALIGNGGNGYGFFGVRNIQANSVTLHIKNSSNTFILNQTLTTSYTFLTDTNYYCILEYKNNIYSFKFLDENKNEVYS